MYMSVRSMAKPVSGMNTVMSMSVSRISIAPRRFRLERQIVSIVFPLCRTSEAGKVGQGGKRRNARHVERRRGNLNHINGLATRQPERRVVGIGHDAQRGEGAIDIQAGEGDVIRGAVVPLGVG